jgi:3-oxoacyl-[acyl-carrier protein] reductase
MNLDLSGKVAIIGGASQGIGYGIARQLATEGASVVITARRMPDLEAAAEKLRTESGTEVLPIAADCRRSEDCQRVVDTVRERFGRLDVLVNNDGAPPLGPIDSFDDVAWQKAIEQNLMYVVRMARASLPLLRPHGGSILNITAISAIQPIPTFGLSVASWAAVIGFAKTLSLEVAAHNINVNTICPGYVQTPRLQKVFAADGKDPDKMRQDLTNEVPMKRLGTVEDISAIVALLVSERGRYITGTSIPVDGGLLRGIR